jgi:hypothetical protein
MEIFYSLLSVSICLKIHIFLIFIKIGAVVNKHGRNKDRFGSSLLEMWRDSWKQLKLVLLKVWTSLL